MKTVIVIGRPNVGKSAFINRMLGSTHAITAREEGVTRDIRYYDQVWNGKPFSLGDTGGMVRSENATNPYQAKINAKVTDALASADTILFMVDVTHPNHPDDDHIMALLAPYRQNVLLVINKVDNQERLSDTHEFYTYGMTPLYPISALQGHGIGDLLDDIVADIDPQPCDDNLDGDAIRMALIGKPNAGKSSLYNALLNQDHALVDAQMGTTRDINESILSVGDHTMTIMDTAGLRRRRKITDTIEYFSTIRTERAMDQADVVVFMLDAQTLLTDQDKKILNHVIESNKNMVVFINKWDTLARNDHTRRDIIRILQHEVPVLAYYPIIVGSARIKHNIQALLDTIVSVYCASQHRIATGPLNQFLTRFFDVNHPPSKKGKAFKVYYATQVRETPPEFVFKVNDHRLLTAPFLRHFEKAFRDFYPNALGVGMAFSFRSKSYGVS